MKTKILILLFVLAISSQKASSQAIKKIFADAEKQTTFMLDQFSQLKTAWVIDDQNKKKAVVVSPRTLSPDGKLVAVSAKDWTSSFFPGVLWYLFEFTGDKKWEGQARTFTSNIENEKLNAGTHDIGFKIYCSFGNGYRLTKDASYREIIIQAAKTLSTRFNPKIGCIRSWDHSKNKWDYPVIIDNMMNLELLFAATRLTGDSSFSKIAISHANTTMKNHYRPDFSSFHVVDYDTLTGNVIKKTTHQGYSNESAWSRGQDWGLYGYTMCYRETKNKKYLEQADKITKSLTRDYRSPMGQNRGFILMHSTGSKPTNSEVDVPLNYADYYYLEALLRQKKLTENKSLF